MGLYYWGFDWTYLLILAAFLVSLVVQMNMNGTFQKYSRVRSMSGMTGAEAAERILRSAGIFDVQVVHIQGNLNDHYDPRTKVIKDVYKRQAWYFATALAKQYGQILPFLEQRRLDKWTHNKAIQKAVESCRITEEQKAYLRTLKIK